TNDNNHSESDPSLYTVLNAASKTFIGYVEDASSNTGLSNGTTPAVRKHNPWESFPEGKTVEQDFSRFPTNFANLPAVSFVIPTLNDDMHDGTVAQGDSWLSTNMGAYATYCENPANKS